jgi:hypothetical protein
MCEKCVEIDQTIARYKSLKRQTADQIGDRAADELIVRLEAEKLALHPEK